MSNANHINLQHGDEKNNLAKRIIKDHLAPYKGLFACALVFMILAAASTAALPYLLKPVFDEVFTAKDKDILFYFCALVLAAFVMKGISSYGESVTINKIGQKIISDIQKRLFNHLIYADLNFFHNITSGHLLSRFMSDIQLMRACVSNALVGLGRDSITLSLLIGLMFYRDWFLACLSFFIFPTALYPIFKIGKWARKIAHENQENQGHFIAHLNQVFHGIRTVKAYGMEESEISLIASKVNRLYELSLKALRIKSMNHPIVETLGGLAIITVIGYSGWQIIQNKQTPGDFISFIGALILAYEPLKRLSNLNATLQEGLAAATRIFELIDCKPSIVNAPNAVVPHFTNGQVLFQNVSFNYPNHQTQVLQNISIHIPAGQTIAVVGPSGSGKSSLINLMPRFYDVTDGCITIDGFELKNLDISYLRSKIALVSQEITLFSGTIKENILYGSQANDEQMIEAAVKASAHDFIISLPNGYDTLVGENGVKLSGGQRQRIAIARAMVKNAPILLLDEATSALDTQSEKQVQNALKNLMQGRTTIMVAHRLSTVMDVDMIYVLSHGKIVEQGNHKQLIKQGGLYAHLWSMQSQTSPDLAQHEVA